MGGVEPPSYPSYRFVLPVKLHPLEMVWVEGFEPPAHISGMQASDSKSDRFGQTRARPDKVGAEEGLEPSALRL